MKIIERSLYLNKIKPFIGKPIIKILTGMRRVGKSELLKQIKDNILKQDKTKKIIYINKEDRKFDYITNNNILNQHIDDLCGDENTVLLIDEIQEIKNWDLSINSFLVEGMSLEKGLLLTR